MVRQASALNRVLPLALAGLVLLQSGCLALKRHLRPDDDNQGSSSASTSPSKPGKPATKVLATWRKQVQFGVNPVNQKPMAALIGRVYLFDQAGLPMIGDGKVAIELYDDSQMDATAGSRLLEKWDLAAETLKRLVEPDFLGVGYTVTLPWPSYRSDVSRVHMAVRYEQKAGSPLSYTDQIMTLDHVLSGQLARRSLPVQPTETVPASATR